MTLCIQPVKYVKHQTVEQWAVLVPAQNTTVLQRLGFEPQVADYKPKRSVPFSDTASCHVCSTL